MVGSPAAATRALKPLSVLEVDMKCGGKSEQKRPQNAQCECGFEERNETGVGGLGRGAGWGMHGLATHPDGGIKVADDARGGVHEVAVFANAYARGTSRSDRCAAPGKHGSLIRPAPSTPGSRNSAKRATTGLALDPPSCSPCLAPPLSLAPLGTAWHCLARCSLPWMAVLARVGSSIYHRHGRRVGVSGVEVPRKMHLYITHFAASLPWGQRQSRARRRQRRRHPPIAQLVQRYAHSHTVPAQCGSGAVAETKKTTKWGTTTAKTKVAC